MGVAVTRVRWLAWFPGVDIDRAAGIAVRMCGATTTPDVNRETGSLAGAVTGCKLEYGSSLVSGVPDTSERNALGHLLDVGQGRIRIEGDCQRGVISAARDRADVGAMQQKMATGNAKHAFRKSEVQQAQSVLRSSIRQTDCQNRTVQALRPRRRDYHTCIQHLG